MTTADSFAPETDIDLRLIWGVIAKYKWIIIGLPIAFAIAAKIAVGFITPIYSASATVMIESADSNIVSIEEMYRMQRRNAQYFDTQFAILRSRPLAEKVVEDLDLVSQPEYRQEPSEVPFFLKWFGVEPKTSSVDPNVRAVLIYMDRLSIRPTPGTQLVDVRFESEDPDLASMVANAHADCYIESSMEARLGKTETAIQWMTEKLGGLQTKLSASEQRLQDFREQYGVIDYDGLKALPSQEIGELTTSLAEARQGVSTARAAFFQVYPDGGDQVASNLEGIGSIQEDSLSQDFRLALVDAQSEAAELSKRLGQSHPTMIDAQAALTRAEENLRLQHERIAARIRNEYEEAQEQESQILVALQRAKTRFQAIGRTEAEFRALERDVQTNRELYDMFYNRIKEAAQAGDLQQADARILSPAVRPIRPVSPDEDMIVGLAFAMSFVVALLSAFLIEALNDKINVNNVESRLGLTMLSMVPLVGSRRKYGPMSNLFQSGTHLPFKESIRTLRTAVSLSNTEELTKVVLVTSSIGGEGKTTISVNLAHGFSQMEKVLLIDSDLRRPSVSTRLGLPPSKQGLCEVLSERAKLDDCVVKHEKNLDILPCGAMPEDALQLLSSRQMGALMRVLRIKYDRIIIDSPPVLPVSDAPVLSAYSDAVILVTRSKVTKHVQAKAALSKLLRVSAAVIGVVVNQWDMRDQGGYGVYSYHSYGEGREAVAEQKAAS